MWALIKNGVAARIFRSHEPFTESDSQFPADVFRWSRAEQMAAGLDIRPLITDPQPDAKYLAVVESTFEVQATRVLEHYVTRPRNEDETAAIIANLRRQVQQQIGARFDAALEAGMAYAGKVLQIRMVDQSNLIAMGAKARDARDGNWTWPANFAWRMADDSFLQLPSHADMITMDLAAATEVYRLRTVRWHHHDQVAALTDPAAILSYDYSVGW